MIVTLCSVLAASILLASNIAAADRIKVAVVPGVAVNLDAARVDALSQDLAEGLASALDIDAVGGLEVRRQLPAEGVPPDCATKPTCTADVAKRTLTAGGQGSVGEKAATAIADFIVVDMFANYCTGTKDAKTAMTEAERQLKRIYR